MTKIEKLTPAQEALIPVIRERWVNFALGIDGGDAIDEKKGEQGVYFLYDLAKLKRPKVVWIDGPNSFASVGDSVGDSVWDSVGDSVWDSVRASVRDSVWDSVRDSVWDSVGDSVWDSVRASVRDSVRASVWASVGDSVSWSSRDLSYDSDFAAWYDFYREAGIFRLEEADKYLDYLKSGCFYSWFFENVAVLVRRPNHLERNQRGRLHSTDGPAISWRDGFKLYFIHGAQFKEDLWQKVTSGKMSGKDVISLDNMEQRMAALQVMEPQKFIKTVGAELLNSSMRGNYLYKLPEKSGIFDRDEYFLTYTDPSTGRLYMKFVPPEIGKEGNADMSQAFTFGLTPEQYETLTLEA